MGYLLAEGGAEFGGAMAKADAEAIRLAGGQDAPVVIVPTAAAPDRNHIRAGNQGRRWFQTLGAKNCSVALIYDKESANDAAIAQVLESATLIYLLGGFTHFLGTTLQNSAALLAARRAYENGAVIAGSSAGAMVMCQWYVDPETWQIYDGLNFIPNTIIAPHFNTFAKSWISKIQHVKQDCAIWGIDERTGVIDDGTKRNWNVLGAGSATIVRHSELQVFAANQTFQVEG